MDIFLEDSTMPDKQSKPWVVVTGLGSNVIDQTIFITGYLIFIKILKNL